MISAYLSTPRHFCHRYFQIENCCEELVVLDKAGRVHIPAEFLEQVQIQGRAKLELTADGILIRRVGETLAQPQQAQSESEPEAQKRSGLRGFFGRRSTGGKA